MIKITADFTEYDNKNELLIKINGKKTENDTNTIIKTALNSIDGLTVKSIGTGASNIFFTVNNTEITAPRINYGCYYEKEDNQALENINEYFKAVKEIIELALKELSVKEEVKVLFTHSKHTKQKREVYEFNSDHMVKKVNTNTCIILAQCLYLGHSIEWANDVNEISELVNHELSLETLAKIISTEEVKKISTNVWFKREDGYLSSTVVKHGKMGTKRKTEVKVNIPKEDILRDTGKTNDYIQNEYDHTPFILSMAIFLGKSIEWANAINEAIEILGKQDDYSILNLLNTINDAITDESEVIFYECKQLTSSSAIAKIHVSLKTLFLSIEGRDLLNGFIVNKIYEFQL